MRACSWLWLEVQKAQDSVRDVAMGRGVSYDERADIRVYLPERSAPDGHRQLPRAGLSGPLTPH